MIDDIELSRRQLLAAAALAGVAIPAASHANRVDASARAATKLDLGDPRVNLDILGRLQADVSGRPIYTILTGSVWGVANPEPGSAIKAYAQPMYDFAGANVIRGRRRADKTIEIAQRGWAYYADRDTGAPLTRFVNPFTGVVHSPNPLTSMIGGQVLTERGPKMAASFPMTSTAFETPMRLSFSVLGDFIWIGRTHVNRWREPSSGKVRTEMTMDRWTARLADFNNANLTHIPNTYSHILVSEWQSWLNMRGRPGVQVWNSYGAHLDSPDAIPTVMRTEFERLKPGWLTMPLDFKPA
jgi:hypothetical protein